MKLSSRQISKYQGETAGGGQLIALLLPFALVLSGCPTLHLPDYPVRTFESYSNTQVAQNVGVVVEPMTESEQIEHYFGTDLRAAGMLPVFILVENRGGTSFLLSKERIGLVSEADDLPQVSQPGRTESEAPATAVGASSAPALLVGSAAAIPLILVSAKLGSDAKEINHNLVVKELRTRTLSPGADAKGFLYFSLPGTYTKLQQLRVRIPITEIPGGDVVTLEIPLTAGS